MDNSKSLLLMATEFAEAIINNDLPQGKTLVENFNNQIKDKPNKLTYIKGEKLDLTGGKIIATYQNQETEISASEFFEFSRKDNPYRYCKNYTLSSTKEENSDLEFKYETIDYITHLKESKKNSTSNNGEEKRFISRFKKRKLLSIYIQDVQTKLLRYYTFDIEGNPINYYEDTLDNQITQVLKVFCIILFAFLKQKQEYLS